MKPSDEAIEATLAEYDKGARALSRREACAAMLDAAYAVDMPLDLDVFLAAYRVNIAEAIRIFGQVDPKGDPRSYLHASRIARQYGEEVTPPPERKRRRGPLRAWAERRARRRSYVIAARVATEDHVDWDQEPHEVADQIARLRRDREGKV